MRFQIFVFLNFKLVYVFFRGWNLGMKVLGPPSHLALFFVAARILGFP